MNVRVKTKMRVRMSAFAPTLTLIFVAPSGIEPEFRVSETLVLSVELWSLIGHKSKNFYALIYAKFTCQYQSAPR